MTAKPVALDDHILEGVEAASAMLEEGVVPSGADESLAGRCVQFDGGYLSPYFVTDPGRMEVVFENPYILIHEEQIRSKLDLLPLLERIAQSGRPLVIVAGDVGGEALATLVVKKLSGSLRVAAVRAPGFGNQRKTVAQGIAVLTQGKAVAKGLDLQLRNLQTSDLGQAKKITIGKNNTVIELGSGYNQRSRPSLYAAVSSAPGVACNNTILTPHREPGLPRAKTGAEGMATYRNQRILPAWSERAGDSPAPD